MKYCKICSTTKKISDFCLDGRDGRRSNCRECDAKRNKKWRLNNPQKAKDRSNRTKRLWRTFGIDKMLIDQLGLCAVCSRQMTGRLSPVIDHDHSCCPSHKMCFKCIRGLLCSNCNTGIGLFNESTQKLALAINYLERFPSHEPGAR